jgi:CDGSH-type Zn-finger protein
MQHNRIQETGMSLIGKLFGREHKESSSSAGESAPTVNVILVTPDGPLEVTGNLELKVGEAIQAETNVALCRCGASGSKPFCDGSHLRVGFHDAGMPATAGKIGAPGPAGKLVLTPVPDGPLLVRGPMELQNACREIVARSETFTLCRCGASNRKPYCDGRHGQIDFVG